MIGERNDKLSKLAMGLLMQAHGAMTGETVPDKVDASSADRWEVERRLDEDTVFRVSGPVRAQGVTSLLVPTPRPPVG